MIAPLLLNISVSKIKPKSKRLEVMYLMYIQIHDENLPPGRGLTHQVFGSHSQVIEQTETWAVAGEGMMGPSGCTARQSPLQGDLSCQHSAAWTTSHMTEIHYMMYCSFTILHSYALVQYAQKHYVWHKTIKPFSIVTLFSWQIGSVL